ncbi:MAG: hypothetical protein ACXWJN_03245 [Methyloceanibacter sp.]
MRKLAIVLTATVAMLFAGPLAWKAEAATLTSAVSIGAKAQTYSPIENTACYSGVASVPQDATGFVVREGGAGAPFARLTGAAP